MANLKPGIPVGTSQISNPDGTVTEAYRAFFVKLFNNQDSAEGWDQLVSNVTVDGWDIPTGTGSRIIINMDWNVGISNPPTQAQVTAVRDQVIVLQKALGQLIQDLMTTNLIGPP